MTPPLRRLPLHDRHVALGARFAPFAGWEMPVQYTGIVAEHERVRAGAGIFDVSHMGRVRLTGPDAGRTLRTITTYDVTRLEPGAAHYALYCNDAGGIDDDVFVYRIDAARWLVVHNAATAAPDAARVAAAVSTANGATAGSNVTANEITTDTVMLAVQGPDAMAQAATVLGGAVPDLAPRHCIEIAFGGGTVLVARTGYTGEDGVECITEPAAGGALWDAFVAAGAAPCGLGARDTLRLEAALPLHGNDIDATTSPYAAGLGWTVTLDDGAPFTGREALVRAQAAPPAHRLACLRATARGVPRAGYGVHSVADGGETPVAFLTSGAHSPTLQIGIAMAYLPVDLAAPGTPLAIEIRGRRLPVEVVKRPFYRRAS